MNKHCCGSMQQQIEFSCEQHASAFDCPDALVTYTPQFNEYALIIHDGAQSGISIAFCPWCGGKLPPSLRSRWFEELETLGFDEPFDQEIPERYRTDAWYMETPES